MNDQFTDRELPTTPVTSGAVDQLESIIIQLFKLLPDVSKQYVKTNEVNRDIPLMLAISAIDWASEKPLRELLQKKWASSSSENTETSIRTYQNTISYGLPALLSPLYAIFKPKNIILSAMERGAYQPGAVVQIDNNVPRETALALTRHARKGGRNLNNIEEVLAYVKQVKLSYWTAVEYRHLTDVSAILK